MADAFKFSDLVTAADEAGFFLFPADTYDVVIDSAEAGQTSTGKQQIKVKFRVVTGPYAGKNAKIFNNFVLSPENANALSFFFRHMEAMGLPREYFMQNPRLQHVAAALIGRPCRIVISDTREYPEGSGKKQNDVTNIMPPGQPGQQTYAAPAAIQPGVPAGLGTPPPPLQDGVPQVPAPQAGPPAAIASPVAAAAVPPPTVPASVEQPVAPVPPAAPPAAAPPVAQPVAPPAQPGPPPQPVWNGVEWVMPQQTPSPNGQGQAQAAPPAPVPPQQSTDLPPYNPSGGAVPPPPVPPAF
jgi:hypothetical protein